MLASATDVAANVQTQFDVNVSSVQFLFDKVPPVTQINFPSDGGRYHPNELNGPVSPITGTAYDPGAPYNSALATNWLVIARSNGSSVYPRCSHNTF